jgi:hypothetical protein
LSRPADEAAFLTEEDLHGERRLACNELIRAKEFASLAENRAQVTQIIDEIEEAFFGDAGIAGFEKEKEVD